MYNIDDNNMSTDLTGDIFNNQYIERLQLYYTTILSHIITPDGRFLIATLKNNKSLAVFPIKKYLKDEIHDELLLENVPGFSGASNRLEKGNATRRFPSALLPVENSLVLCPIPDSDDSRYKFILGGEGSIKGYRMLAEAPHECHEEWTIKLPNSTSLANAITLMKNRIITGSGDNKIYLHDQETRQEVAVLSGHQDYIHDLKSPDNDSLLYSASEDGSVRLWDLRQEKDIRTIMPYKNANIRRSQFGKWIGTIDVSGNGEWLLCGGGPMLSIWHVRSDRCAHIIKTPSVVYHGRFFSNSDVLAAGSGNAVTVWQRSDPDEPYQIPIAIPTVYSIAHHYYEEFGYDMHTFAGDSYQIDICQNVKFVDWKLYVA